MGFLVSYSADILIICASLGAMIYCMILSRRLSRLTSFDKGLGGAIAVMSSQVEEMKAALKEAKSGTDGAGTQLSDLVVQAREISSELELMIAACHDFAEEAISVQAADAADSDTPVSTPAEASVSDPPSDAAGPVFGTRRTASDADSTSVAPLFGRRGSAVG